MHKKLTIVAQFLDEHGFYVLQRSQHATSWARNLGGCVTREEITVQESSLSENAVVGVLRISIRSRLWDGLVAYSDGDAFVDAITVEWGSNGVFPYGWQAWVPWDLRVPQALLQDMEAQALPWLHRHSRPENLIEVLEREVAEGVPRSAPSESVMQKVMGSLLLGKARVGNDERHFPRGHKRRLAELHYELGNVDAAVYWARSWLADMEGWREFSSYEQHLRRIEQRP